MSSPQLKSTTLYKNDKFLGAGSYGAVNLISIKENGKKFALKEFHLNKILDPTKRKLALEEATMEYQLLKNPLKNVIQSYGSNYDAEANKFMFSMEYYPENLREYIEKNKQINFSKFIPIFNDIITGKHLIITYKFNFLLI